MKLNLENEVQPKWQIFPLPWIISCYTDAEVMLNFK